MNRDQQLLLCSLEMIHCLFHMLVIHVWYVSHPSVNLGAHESYGLMVVFQPFFFLRNLELSIDSFSNLIPIKIYKKEGKYNQKKKKKIE